MPAHVLANTKPHPNAARYRVAVATVSAYLKAALQFEAKGSISSTTGAFDYEYGAYLFYNLGYKAKATVLKFFDWSLGDRNAYPQDRRLDIYGPKTGSIPLSGGQGDGKNRRRMVRLIEAPIGEEVSYANESLSALLDPMYLFKRADDGDLDGDGPTAATFKQPITCPAGSSASIKIPELRGK